MGLEARRAFYLTLLENSDPNLNFVYCRRQITKKNGLRLNYISVIMDIAWPMHKGSPISVRDLSDDLRVAAAAGAIKRVQEFLERQTLQELSLIDIRTGCIALRFELIEKCSEWVVLSAIKALEKEANAFSVTSVSAHINGRKIAS